ncbi:GIY-YIG nuclease family protein [Xylocopilactobacillus apis]|uniref:GIY-YIG domain-containing protein n=1 Tax=Xylocopilactobacillus apis TaxID=2932183 RepID=A0AAU9DLN3_9LACO|nr:GIY-YIG nuclease family protein [Xylocopilactobacillus apis]BDR56494.1 hypothetical protein KIMC2_10560 [Xylocopilactobacillus apis]
MDEYYFYVVLCSNGAFYAGTTNNVENRIKAHNSGKGAKYTRAHRPVKLIYQETFPSKGEALSFELKFKRFNRQKKENYLKNHCNQSKK